MPPKADTQKIHQNLSALAESKGGKLLSKDYQHRYAMLEWECDKGHKWEASAHNIKAGNGGKGTWCPLCRKGGAPKSSAETVKALVESRGGHIVRIREYKDNNTAFLVECSSGHRFRASLKSLQQNRWCPECAPNRRITYQQMKDKITSLGGELLSSEDGFRPSDVLVRCVCGNEWRTNGYRILDGRWCTACSYQRGILSKKGVSGPITRVLLRQDNSASPEKGDI